MLAAPISGGPCPAQILGAGIRFIAGFVEAQSAAADARRTCLTVLLDSVADFVGARHRGGARRKCLAVLTLNSSPFS